jgi:hypothetical protein
MEINAPIVTQQYPSRYYSNATKDLTCHNIEFVGPRQHWRAVDNERWALSSKRYQKEFKHEVLKGSVYVEIQR